MVYGQKSNHAKLTPNASCAKTKLGEDIYLCLQQFLWLSISLKNECHVFNNITYCDIINKINMS